MTYPKIPLAQTVVLLCKAKNIRHIIISPGSRNAPLTIGFTNDEFFSCYSIVDERCAAFFALGIAQRLQQPTALVCTSGSALLNYYPAISEAFYSDIPLVVLSADRPKHLVGIGDGQTINQKNVFANHILYSANLKQDIKEENTLTIEPELPVFKSVENKQETLLAIKQSIQLQNETDINTALNTAIFKKAPVHINIPFDEPLYETVDMSSVSPKSISIGNHKMQIDQSILNKCIIDWNIASKKMVLVGANQPNQIEKKWLDVLANDNSVIVFTEATSNLHHDSFFPSIDKIIAPLTEIEFEDLKPDILLTFGGMVVSKKVKAFLRHYKPIQHWHVDTKKANDTFFILNRHIKTTANYFISCLLKETIQITSNYKLHWNFVKKRRKERHNNYLDQIEFSDLKVFDLVLKSLPNNSILHLGNSSAVRYAQLFDLDLSLEVFCNRGTSGIDGSTSTAIGCAVINNKQTTLITGDLSFLYDSNALWNNHIPNNFRIIVINNGGGGIFRILPGHKDTENFDTYFETSHDLNARHLCKMFGFKYEAASNQEDLELAINTFYNMDDSPKLLEIFTPAKRNNSVLLDYFKFIK